MANGMVQNAEGRGSRIRRRAVPALAFAFGAVVLLLHRPFSQMESRDPAIYDYIAQSILRGQLPYRDVIDIKWPGSHYLSAGAMALGNLFGMRDILAVRLMHVLLFGLLAAITYAVAREYLRNWTASALGFVIPLIPSQFSVLMITGTQPKLPMMVFGMLSLLLIARDRPFWAGFASMLSCLCWQPGLMFTGTAFLIFSRYLSTWRDWRAAKVLAGAAIPLAAVLSYFALQGVLGDFWAWTMTYNYSVFGPAATKEVGAAASQLWARMREVWRSELLVGGLALVGLVLFVARRALSKLKTKGWLASPDLYRDAVALPPIVYLAFSLVNFQGTPDLIPFFPFIGIFCGSFLLDLCRPLSSNAFSRRWQVVPQVGAAAPAVALIVAALAVSLRASRYRIEGWTLNDQDREFQVVADQLGPDDKIFCHGSTEILVYLNRPNLNPYVLLDWGADEFLAARTPGGFDAILGDLEAAHPKIVALARLRAVFRRAELERWVSEHYVPLGLSRYERVYIRRG